MPLKNLQNKKIALLGLGVENNHLLRYLLKNGVSGPFIICDQRTAKELDERIKEFKDKKNIKWVLNKFTDKDLDGIEIAFRSPGWPLFDVNVKTLKKQKTVVSSAMQLFLDLCPTKNIIGVSGTKGKGTTATLILEILKTAGKTVHLGGNIGVAPFSFLDKIKKDDYVVLELSSFQLEDLIINPLVGIITNFSREHLQPADPNNPNHHKSMTDYWQAKFNIIRNQGKSHCAIINKKLKEKTEQSFGKNAIRAKKNVYFGKSVLDTSLIGEHNKENIAAAEATAKFLKINKKHIATAVKNFRGLEHRLEFVREKNGINYFNDSFATMPDASITALKSFERPIILLAGGADKGNDFKELAELIKAKVKFLIIFAGAGSDRLLKRLNQANFKKENIAVVNSMPEAMAIAKERAVSGDIVLLSPGCASFGVFRNYKERGNLFKLEVSKAY